jgi:hypothetical protein
MNAEELNAIRARLAALNELFPPVVEPHMGEEYYYISDKWGDEIVTVSARYINPLQAEAAIRAIFAAPADIRALLDALEHEQQGHVLDFLKLKAAQDRIDRLEHALRAIIMHEHPRVNKIAYAALRNEDEPKSEET